MRAANKLVRFILSLVFVDEYAAKLQLFPNFSLHRAPFQYFFVSLSCQTPFWRLADILKKRRCTNALSAATRI